MKKIYTLLVLLLVGITSLSALEKIRVSTTTTPFSGKDVYLEILNSDGSSAGIARITKTSLSSDAAGVISFVINESTWTDLVYADVKNYIVKITLHLGAGDDEIIGLHRLEDIINKQTLFGAFVDPGEMNLTGDYTFGSVTVGSGANTTTFDGINGILKNFIESNYLYSTKYGVKLLARNDAQTSVDFVLSPKGAGSIIAQQPDGATTGGNNRGANAVDLQMVRSSASQVASGEFSTTIGGRNTASQQYSTAIGSQNIASNVGATAIGWLNTASGLISTAMGYYSFATGEYSTAIGYSNTASGKKSLASGYNNAAQSFGETVLGIYATIGAGDPSAFVPTDRLFVIGNGNPLSSRSDAFTILKNANTKIGGSLTINGNGTDVSYTFPTDRGTNGYFLKTSADGTTSWAAGGDIVNGGNAVAVTIGTTTDNALSFKVNGEKAGQVSSGSNTSFGYQTLNSNTTGAYNTAVGNSALYSNTTGNYNTANGYMALFSNVANNRSTAIGYNAMYNADNRTSARVTYNTAVGYEALKGSSTAANNTGQWNTAVGDRSLYVNTTGYSNTANGNNALNSNTTGNQNTANGSGALYSNTTGEDNTANGYAALLNNTTGNQNTANGYQAGRYIADGTTENQISSYSVYLGATTKAGASGNTNEIIIGYDATGAGTNTVTLGNTAILTTVLRGNVLHYGTTSGYVGLQAPATVSTPYTLTLPTTAPASNGQVLSATTAGSLTWSDPSSGLNNFTESNYLYNTRYGVKLLARNDAQFDVDFVLSPKGSGSILAQQPDGTTEGGNIRGRQAVDLQMLRTSATQVAKGNFSITIGSSNTANGIFSTAIGASNTASSNFSFASGYGNTAQACGETVVGNEATIGTGSTTNFIPTDRLFVVGNGVPEINRSDALTILKNANTTIGGSLTINGNGSGTSLTLPATRGTSGNILTTDGIGGTSWTAPSGGTITAVTGTAPIVSSGGTSPAISISAATASSAGSMSAADKAKLDGSTHAIGDSYGGGIVFYVYDGGRHGLIAATADQSTGVVWTTAAFQLTGSNSVRDGINGGQANTERIIIQAGAGSYAAQLCANYQGGNYADWYLPSKYELNLLYLQQFAVGGFDGGYSYWSSTEYDANGAYFQSFGGSNTGDYDKSFTLRVRAIRAF